MLTPITNIVNLSLESGSFPDVLKESHITPLLKKPSLSKDDMKNYRPVSNLNFISKIIEKIISNRIRSHLDKNNLSNPYQSANQPFSFYRNSLAKNSQRHLYEHGQWQNHSIEQYFKPPLGTTLSTKNWCLWNLDTCSRNFISERGEAWTLLIRHRVGYNSVHQIKLSVLTIVIVKPISPVSFTISYY